MTIHDPNLDLGDRLRASAAAVTVPPGAPTDAVARGRERQKRRRAVAGVATAGLVLVGILALPSVQPGPPRGPVILDDVDPSPSPSPTPSVSMKWTPVPPAGIPQDDWSWEVVRYGENGVFAPTGRDGTTLQDGNAGPVVRALPLPDGGVANQVEDGTIRIARDPQVGEDLVLQTTGESVRLLAHRAAYGELWWSARLPGGERDEEHLFVHDLATGQTRDAGVSAGLESFTDELAFDASGDRAAWLRCHLQCTAWVGAVDDLLNRGFDAQSQGIAGGWLYGVAIAPDGLWVASVEAFDPSLLGDDANPSQVVVWDLNGNEVARVDLPRHLIFGATRVEFTPDGASLLVGDAGGAWVLEGVEGGGRPRELLAATGPSEAGAALTGRASPAALREASAPPTSEEIEGWYEPVAWPLAGRRALAWTRDDTAEDRPWQTSAPNVVQSFLVQAGVASGPEPVTMVGEAPVWGGESRTYETGATDRHGVLRVTVARFETSPHWWVLGRGGGAEGSIITTVARNGDDLMVGGSLPDGATSMDVASLDAPNWIATSDSGDGGWFWEAIINGPWGAEPLSVLLRAEDEDGRVVHLSSFVFPGRGGAAG